MFNPFFLQTSESLQQVARSFGEVSHRPEETPLITAGILVAAAVLAYLLWKKISGRPQVNTGEPGPPYDHSPLPPF